MRYFSLLCTVLATFTLGVTASTAADLMAGGDLSNWEFITDPAVDLATVCTMSPNGVIAISGSPIGYIATKQPHQDYRLHVEWRWGAAPANGGIMLHIASGPKDRQWPLCLQVQLKHTRAGDIIPMAGATFTEMPAAPATQFDRQAESSEKPPGEWNAADIVCRGGEIECAVNGVPQNHITGCAPASGTIGFQFEGAPFELRNIRLEPLEQE